MHYGTKNVANDFHRIAVWWLVREARKSNFKAIRVIWGDDTFIVCQVVLSPNRSFVRFSYDNKDLVTGEPKHFEYNIFLGEASCYFGGNRHWFICGLQRDGKFCGKWVGVLYRCGDYFACRHCFNLTYRTRNDNRRGAFYPALHFLDVSEKVRALENRIKVRRLYAGKLTKKAKRLEQLLAQTTTAAREVKPIENYD